MLFWCVYKQVMYNRMKKLILFLLICNCSASYSQDSLFVGKVYSLPHVSYSYCWGEEWTEKQFQEEYSSAFDSISQFLQFNSKVKFEIRFYTDSRGSDSANLVLSQRKADDWYSRLVKRGVDSSQLKPIGFGESTPRTVWVKDTIYYLDKSEDVQALPVVLTEHYINTFRKTDKRRFEMLHQLNRREELVITSIEE